VDIERVKQTGRRVKAGHFDVRVAPSPLLHVRVGIIVPKYRHTIVARNQLKRRLRELVRVRVLPVVGTPGDIVIRVLPKAYRLTFDQLARDIDGVVAQLD
jgi:ribonuclease P protein component